MPEFVRFRAENGHIVTHTKEFAEANGFEPLDPDKYPAVNTAGQPLPEEPSTPTAKKKVAEAEKEETR